MLYRRVILLGTLCVLFVGPMALGQPAPLAPSTTSDNPTLSEVQVTILKGIYDAKIELTTDIAGVKTDVAVLKTEQERMKEDIRDLQGTLTWIWRGLIVGSIVIPIGLYFLKRWWENRGKGGEVGVTDTTVSPQEQIDTKEKYADNTEPDYQTAGGGS